jgi:hypothetical protein
VAFVSRFIIHNFLVSNFSSPKADAFL